MESNRHSRGSTLAELTISMAITSLLAAGSMFAFQGISGNLQNEISLGTYQDTVRLGLHQLARDVRLAGANPAGNTQLFDGDPSTDVAFDIDPDHDGNLTNAVLVQFDKTGRCDNRPDGDSADELERVLYSYDAANKRVMRAIWRIYEQDGSSEPSAGYDTSVFLDNVCSFKITYLDALNATTTDANKVNSVLAEVTTAAGPRQCFEGQSFTRYSYARIRLRNR